MEDAGQKLKRVRERLRLRFRDVEEASSKIAQRHKNDEFTIALSRLADIENKGTVPSLYRLYALCAIYRLDISEVLEWYGIKLSDMLADAAGVEIERTHTIGITPDSHGEVVLPLALDPGMDVRRTTFLSRFIQRWGKIPLMLLNGVDLKGYRYAFVGTDDWTMDPLIPPGSLVLIDESRRKVASGGWTDERDRPIYLIEHRDGYMIGWCHLQGGQLTLIPHPASTVPPRVFAYPSEAEVIGQVTAVVTHLDQGRRRGTRS
jgi:transcriptional regulator with XRE-family HTH domain